MNSLLIKSAEAAKRLGVSRATLHRWVKAGKIACIQIERNAIYFTEDDLMQFIAASKTKYSPSAA